MASVRGERQELTRGESKITVRQAISAAGPDTQPAVAGRFAKFSEWLRWLSHPIVRSARNTFRRKGRLALTLFTSIMAGGVFITVFNVRSSMEHFMVLSVLASILPARNTARLTIREVLAYE
ncbi:MAG: hypothetical protein JSV68_23565 [Anaerolineaceae bacterium]|nr:MAG: hypothetical protein JSV68_23565 [Anaerolineaceae bacterium]